ncbi:M60 family metallopeptidase [Sphingobacterium shayense]|uniref:M60 family metallopeptidase n=1 Tax=Sphingobacterium shayense TaxID=626343 RepID=UPI001FE5B4C8|nr:M60 family metallopeptidase [Sphingobacterium shayense]
MKLIYRYSCLTIISLLVFASCGKYGYDFENGYGQGDSTGSPIAGDTTLFVADKSLYPRARIFPGLAGENVPRITDTTVTLNLNFEYSSANDRMVNVVPQSIFSTGLYAPAGELIRVIVPSGVLGLTMQIGVHTDNLTGKTPLRRDAIIYTVKELFPGVNYVRNLYGGTVWIRPNISRDTPVDLVITGAVRASDFVLGKTDVNKWIADVQANDVPWLELRSKHVTFNVPRTGIISFIQEGKLRDIDQVMQEWDQIYEKDYYDWMGLTPDATELKNKYPNLPERGVLDIQPSAGYGHSGNPWVAQNDRQWLDEWINLNTIRTGKSWGTYHEIGHNYQQVGTWSWNGLGETTNNLFVFKGLHRNGVRKVGDAHPALKGAFEKALAYASSSAIKDQISDAQANGDDAPFFKLVPFLQIFNKATGKRGESGWDFMPYIYNKARNIDYAFGVDEAKRDFFYRMLCEFTGKDYARFCQAWGIVISGIARKEMAAKYPPMEHIIWQYSPLTDTGGDDPLPPKVDLFNTAWTILDKSTEEPTGEGPPNGQAISIIDGQVGTFWHSQWSAATAVLPHSITFDFNTVESVKGFYLVPRQGNSGQRPKDIEVHISDDNVTYTKLTDDDLMSGYSFQMPNTDERKEFRLKTLDQIRYVKIYFRNTNHNGSGHHAIAEFGAFYDVD